MKAVANTSFSLALSRFGVLAIVIGLGHGLLLLNDGVYWDGWILYGLYLNADADSLFAFFRESGLPWIAYFHRFWWNFGDIIFTYKLVAFASILLASWLLHAILLRLRSITEHEALFIAAMYGVYTGYQVHAELITLPYTFFVALFIFATFLTLISDAYTGYKRIAARAVALSAFFLSFNINSLLVVYPVALALMLMQTKDSFTAGWRTFFQSAFGFSAYLLIPLGYWAIKSLWWAQGGAYGNYNIISFDPERWSVLVRLFIQNSVVAQFINAYTTVVSSSYLLCIVLLASLAGTVYLIKRKSKTDLDSAEQSGFGRQYLSTIYLAVISIIIFLLAILPYVAVGKFAAAEGWNTRHALLVSLPVALLLVALARIPNMLFPKNKYGSYAMMFLANVLVWAMVILTNQTYIYLEARWVKDLSIISNLRTFEPVGVCMPDFYDVEDQYPVTKEKYRMYEYSGFFKLAWQREDVMGISKEDKPRLDRLEGLPYKRFMLKNYTLPPRCRATMKITAVEPTKTNVEIVRRYMLLRFNNHDQMPEFLSSLTRLEVMNVVSLR